MQFVPINWYKYLNYVLGVGLFFIIASHFTLEYATEIDARVLGLGLPTLILAILAVVYVLGVFPFIYKRSPSNMAAISFVLTTAAVASIVSTGGAFEAPLYFVWLFIVFASGMFGLPVVSIYFVMTVLYFAMQISDVMPNETSMERGLLIVGVNLFASVVSYVFWRHFYVSKREDDQKVSNLSKKLEAEKTKSDILINAIADGFVVVDEEEKVQIFNPAAQSLTGWTVNDAGGMSVSAVLRLVRPAKEGDQEVPIDQHPFHQAITTKQQVVDNQSQIVTQSGKKFEVSLSVSPIIINDVVEGAVGVFRDVSSERKQERQRAEFISTASHEMRTPVAAIEGYLALAMNEKVAQIDDKARGYLQKAHESSQHLGQLFKDLLTAAKSEDGRLSNHPEVVELNDFLQKVADDLRFSAEEKGLEMKYELSRVGDEKISAGSQVVSPLYYVHVDPERIREVITNLVTNAIKFTDKGGITLGLSGNSSTVQITIADTGYGIPKEDIPHLFQKFYRVDNSSTRSIGGTGLGLFISRNIIELYKGKIWVESELNKGSTFFINLPRLDVNKAEELKKQEATQTTHLESEQTLE